MKRPVAIVDAGIRKALEIEVVIPVEDMSQLGQVKVELTPGPASAALTERRSSIWPSIYPEILTRILANRSTIIFCNGRRATERLAAKLNELYDEQVVRLDVVAPGSTSGVTRADATSLPLSWPTTVRSHASSGSSSKIS